MQKMTLEMPRVAHCDVDTCVYNAEKKCHAKAITVGDHSSPACDTFFVGNSHVSSRNIQAGVGACKVEDCEFNHEYECQQNEVQVGKSKGFVLCLSFQKG